MRGLSILAAALVLAVSASFAEAVVHNFDLTGKAGVGLLSGNENGTISGTPGSGGEVGGGITYDDVTNQLTINIAWGSGNGFTDLSGNAIGGHIHGPTANPAPAGFFDDAGVVIGLDSLGGWNANAVNGGFSGTVTLTAGQETDLMGQRYYINIHTPTNGGGEIRGHLVPEPGSLALIAVAGLALFRRRRAA